jgi:hypothetical protein
MPRAGVSQVINEQRSLSMNHPARWLGCAILLVAVVALAGSFREHWIVDWDLGEGRPNENQKLEVEERRHHRLEAKRKEVFRRIAGRERVLAAVIDDRLTLCEAAAHFRVLDAKVIRQEWFREYMRRSYPGRSDDERQCHRVIAYVQEYLKDRPRKAASVTKRLQDQVGEQLNHHGSIHLPKISGNNAPAVTVSID